MKVIQIDDDIKHIESEEIKLESDFLYWIMATPEELQDHNGIFNFHSLTIRECLDSKQNARLDIYNDYNFLVLNILEIKNNVITSMELDIFIGNNFIVTVTKEEVELLSSLEKELINFKQNVIFSNDRSIVKILFYIFDRIIVNDYEVISYLENVADSIEIKILKNADKRYLNELIHIRRQVHKLRGYISPMRYVGDSLVCNDNNVIGDDYSEYFLQVSNRIDKLIYSVDSLVQYLVLVREAFEAEISNKTNELMKLFTVIATIFLPLTVVTGIFGMNFENMQILKHERGFEIVVGSMMCVSLCLFILFKRKKWL